MKKLTGRETVVYSAYGYEPSSDTCRLVGFSGYWRDLKTDCYPLGNGYRMFNTRLMRFHSPDELSPFLRGGINAYMYCGGDPVNKKDESGRAGTGLTALLKQHRLPKKPLKPFFKMLQKDKTFILHQRTDTSINTFKAARTANGFSLDAQEATQTLPAGAYLNQGDLYISWRKGAEARMVVFGTKFKYIELQAPTPTVALDGPRTTLAPNNDYSTLPSVVGHVRAGARDGDDPSGGFPRALASRR
ncbi:RHS repeat-associated core domain-containing protein [Pseudomonas xanthosomatis]|uniref:RHS repeat-associated core domain-containing protein n=1 Tax=Pseudomonas xanthosomatis TaxID=2842356 RepID=UPI003517CECB